MNKYQEALNTMCRRCINLNECMATGCEPKKNLSELVSTATAPKHSVIDILEEVKSEICDNYCKYVKECNEALDNGEDFYCPLDKL